VRIEEGLPYVSALLAAGATWAAAARPASALERGLKTLAIGSLAVFAFLRGVAPSTLSAALILSGVNQALPPRKERPAWASGSTIAGVLAWLAFAWLFWREGLGRGVIGLPLRMAMIGAVVVLAVAVLLALRRRLGQAGPAAAVDLSVLALMLAASFTLPFGLWPAMAGAFAVCVCEVMTLERNLRPHLAPAGERVAQWLLCFAGQAAIATVFLR
jgi:hypothetical protein